MQPYSLDLRERVMKAYDEGKWTVGEIARRYDVGEWWIHKLKRQRQKEGSLAPHKGKVGQPQSIAVEQLGRLVRYVDKHPDATLEQIHGKIGANCTLVTIHNTLRRLGYRYKKNAEGQRTRSR
jgi:transposase